MGVDAILVDKSMVVNGRVMATMESSVTRTVRPCCPSVLASPLDGVQAGELAQGFTALADPVRLRLLSLLAASPSGEVCVCDLVAPLGKSQPTVSHHLKILSEAGLVRGDRRGKWVWYSLNRARLAALRDAIDA
ncbi:MAG TPA: metalloregulator ArsR/SmtB family transcription factor [Acidimicrobiales bacterium]|jgi:ArsR family transcriptional regulator